METWPYSADNSARAARASSASDDTNANCLGFFVPGMFVIVLAIVPDPDGSEDLTRLGKTGKGVHEGTGEGADRFAFAGIGIKLP
jgi:hypothetical protein